MPKSRKRKKKPQEKGESVYVNPLKKRWGRTVVIILAAAFLLGIVAGTIFLLFQVMQQY